MADTTAAPSSDVNEHFNQHASSHILTTDRETIKKILWTEFREKDLKISEESRTILLKYTRIPDERLDAHLHRIRDEAFKVYPYPCIGLWRFLDFGIGHHQLYRSEILPRMLTGGQIYLDLGCALAQDIRRLVHDSVDSKQCYGSDLRLEFLDFGYELFNDKETLQSKFIAADVFDQTSELFDKLSGKVDIVGASSFFHLFDWEEQKAVARSVVKLLKPQKDSLVVGRQIGSVKPAEYPRRFSKGTRYRHDVESWRRMWEEVGKECDVTFEVQGRTYKPEYLEGREMRVGGDDTSVVMEYSVRRLN